MRIAAKLVSGLGRVLLGAALFAFLLAFALLGIASYLVSWPYRKLYSPREASLRLTLDLLTVLSAAWHLRAAAAASAGEEELEPELEPEGSGRVRTAPTAPGE